MAFEFLLDHRVGLVIVVVVLALANIALVPIVAKNFARQSFVGHDEWNPPIAGRPRSTLERVMLSLFWTFVVCLASFGLDRPGVEFALGGYFVLQLVSFVLSLAALMTARTLKDPRSANGRITYTAVYRYRSFAAYLVAAFLAEVIAYLLSGRLVFAGAALFSILTAAGCYRRSRQAGTMTQPA